MFLRVRDWNRNIFHILLRIPYRSHNLKKKKGKAYGAKITRTFEILSIENDFL